MPMSQLLKRLVAVHQFSAFGLCEAMFDLRGDPGSIVGKPLFLLMEQLNGMGDEFIGGLVGTTLHVLLDKGLQLGI